MTPAQKSCRMIRIALPAPRSFSLYSAYSNIVSNKFGHDHGKRWRPLHKLSSREPQVTCGLHGAIHATQDICHGLSQRDDLSSSTLDQDWFDLRYTMYTAGLK